MTIRARHLLAGLVAIVTASSVALAEPPTWSGGGRGGGGKPSAPDLYGDMVLIDRTEDGVPITTLGLGPKDKWMQVPQPIMLGPKADCLLWPLGGDPVVDPDVTTAGPGLIPVDGDSIYVGLGIEAYRIPFVDGEIPEDYGLCTTEADFGRLSSARSPDEVFDHALREMVTTLVTARNAGGTIDLDAAGRLMVIYDTTDEYGEPITIEKTIDAPLENMAAVENILETAGLSHAEVGDVTSDLPVWPQGHSGAQRLLDRAAALMGGAGDKTGYIGMDEVVYLTLVRAITSDMNGNATTTFGVLNDNPAYFNFRSFSYDRSATYAGDVCYLKVEDPGEATNLPVSVSGQIVKEPILQLVFPPLEEGADYVGGLTDQGDYTNFTGSNVWAFARAADDARAVIQWVHDHPVPIELADYCKLD